MSHGGDNCVRLCDQLLPFVRPHSRLEVARLFIIPCEAAVEEGSGAGAKVGHQGSSSLGLQGQPGLVLQQGLQLLRCNLLAPDVGHHHLMSGQVEVFLLSDDLPQLLHAQRQRLPGQLVLCGAHQGILLLISEPAAQDDAFGPELLFTFLEVGQCRVLHLKKVRNRCLIVLRWLRDRFPDAIQILLPCLYEPRERCAGAVPKHEQEHCTPLVWRRCEELQVHLEDGLQQWLSSTSFASNILCPHVDEHYIRSCQREQC
mmetsp:Transcript_3599/g.10458  ORF Transcript_3599/g.10458 Transcript_3599/m.10458 type:complete len:258 (+) Transcript_3599:2356-3129(+)